MFWSVAEGSAKMALTKKREKIEKEKKKWKEKKKKRRKRKERKRKRKEEKGRKKDDARQFSQGRKSKEENAHWLEHKDGTLEKGKKNNKKKDNTCWL